MTRVELRSVSGHEPLSWKDGTLRDLVSLQRGHDLTWRDRREGEVPVMGSAGQNGFHDTALAKGPGLVLGRSGASFGQAHYCEEAFWPHNTALYATDFHGNEPLFVFYRLKLIDFSRHNTGGAQQSLNRNFIYPIPVRIPSPEEQQAIAAALSDVDALLGALDRLIAKKRDLKQAAMQQLLTGQTRLPGFSGKWMMKTVGSVLSRGRLGGNYPNQDRESDFPLMKMGNVARGYIDTSTIEYISSGITPDPKHRLCYGDVLFNTRNTMDLVGKVAIWRNELPVAYYNSNLMRLEFLPEEVSSNEFANYALNSASAVAQLRALATGTTSVAAIYTRDLFEMPFVVPPGPEQKAIAKVLSDMDAELATLAQRYDKTRLLKQGMMQELLTGRTRLI